MGTNSRERHKAKKKARTRSDRGRPGGSASEHHSAAGPETRGEYEAGNMAGGNMAGGNRPGRGPQAPPTDRPPASFTQRANCLLNDAAQAFRDRNTAAIANSLRPLVDDTNQRWQSAAEVEVLGTLVVTIRGSWSRGWQPRDLVRIVDRQLGSRHRGMTVDLTTIERGAYATATVSESWDSQLAELGCREWWSSDGHVTSLAAREGITRVEVFYAAFELLDLLRRLPTLPTLGPIPGQGRRGSLGRPVDGGDVADSRMLERVRALLAKAEATEYAEEADALTAKAQELMTRHSIDYTLLAATTTRQQPTATRVGIDNPYEDAKAVLLERVAQANGGQSVFSKHLGFATVVAFPRDLAAVELLFTSLLVQATAAMMRAGGMVDSAGRSRTRSFRQSFLYAYAVRIGERLQAAAEEIGRTAAEERGVALVPVLAAKRDAVDEALKGIMGNIEFKPFSISNQQGWISGTAAADLANVNVRDGLAT